MNPNYEAIRRLQVMYGLSRKDAAALLAARTARDTANREIKRTLPTYWSETLGTRVTVPQE